MANRTIEAILRLSSKLGSMAAFGQLSGHLSKVDGKAKAFNRTQGMIAVGAREMHATLLRYAAPAAAAYGAKQAFVDFAALERQMNRIGITADASAEETKAAMEVLHRSAKQFAMPIEAAIAGLDTLVSSGMSLNEAMAFLPAVLSTAQAAGASTVDIANTAQKAASALKLEASELQKAFDIMVTGGKAGQFELKDMAAYVPELANSFASLGYEGEDGLKKLVALLQTLREDTGSAGAAATQAQNIFGKMYSEETANKFKKAGINLRSELQAAKAAGEDAVAAFVRISKEAIDGDLSKLPLLFTDQEFRLGMQSLITSADSYKKFIDTVNGSEVDGSVLRDLGRVLEDNQAKIDRMSASWDRLKSSAGGALAGPTGAVMDTVSDSIDYGTAVNAGLEKSGEASGFWERTWWGLKSSQAEKDAMARRGGYKFEGEVAPNGDRTKDDYVGPPVPSFRPEPPVPTFRPSADQIAREDAESRGQILARREAIEGRKDADAVAPSPGAFAAAWADLSRPIGAATGRSPDAAPPVDWSKILFGDLADGKGFREAMKIDADVLKQGGQEAGDAIKLAGDGAGQAIRDAAYEVNKAGSDAGSAFANMVRGLGQQIGTEAATAFKNNVGTVAVKAQMIGAPALNVSGERGRTMPQAGATPVP